MKRTRAERRHFLRRVKARARYIMKAIFSDFKGDDDWIDDRQVGIAASVHCVWCSGPCCGNPRRHFKERTMQEKKFDDEEKSQRRDLGLE